MQDLSHLAENSITATSQAAGNMLSSNAQAMTAPGSEPVDPLPDRARQDDPNLTQSGPDLPVGYSGKPQASEQAGTPSQPRPQWAPAATPGVTRDTRFDRSAEQDPPATGSPPGPHEPNPGTRLSFNTGAAGVSAAGSAAE